MRSIDSSGIGRAQYGPQVARLFSAIDNGERSDVYSAMAKWFGTELACEVVAEAKVVPVQYASLSLPTGGIVSQVLVSEGDDVEVGQVLVRLESAQQAAAVGQAEAGLRRAQAALAELKAGPSPEEIAVAQASVEAAQAGLSQIQERARPEEVAAAEADLEDLPEEMDEHRRLTNGFKLPAEGLSWEAHEASCLCQALEAAGGNRAQA